MAKKHEEISSDILGLLSIQPGRRHTFRIKYRFWKCLAKKELVVLAFDTDLSVLLVESRWACSAVETRSAFPRSEAFPLAP